VKHKRCKVERLCYQVLPNFAKQEEMNVNFLRQENKKLLRS